MVKILNFKIIKKIAIVFVLLVLSLNFCQAANLEDAFKGEGPLDKVAGDKGAGYDTGITEPDEMISLVINTILSFIGVVFLALAIYGGYTWMTARGNEELVTKAKNTLTNAIIGLILVLAAYGISWYVVKVLGDATLK
ncbi:MAG: hypothetical protein PHF50_00325 [Patescibacteria group bacterium]|nr:hypothetical protein [Patescibacteria group bacterium]